MSATNDVFLGVDGGGTDTALCLVGGDGRLLARLRAPSLYYLDEGIELVDRVLSAAVRRVCDEGRIAPSRVTFAFLGLPTYGEIARNLPRLDAAPRGALGHDRYRCDNDTVCAWAGSLAAQDGINVLAGTGSMTYGRRSGTGVRVGGWGALFGDEGSAYWVAVRGLNLATRMSDGRLPEGPLLGVLRAHLGLSSDFELVDIVLGRWRGARREVAALSRQVAAAADAGDRHAGEVLDAAGHELALLVEATRRRLAYPAGEPVPVSYSGGMLTSVARVRAALQRELTGLGEGYELREPRLVPDVGAAVYAAQLAGRPLGEGALARLARESARADQGSAGADERSAGADERSAGADERSAGADGAGAEGH